MCHVSLCDEVRLQLKTTSKVYGGQRDFIKELGCFFITTYTITTTQSLGIDGHPNRLRNDKQK